MKHLIFIFVICSSTHLLRAQEFLSVSQFKHRPGVEVSTKNDPAGETSVIIEILDKANFMASSDFASKGPSQLTIVLNLRDSDHHELVRAPLNIQRIISGTGISGQEKSDYLLITFDTFDVQTRLLSGAFLDFHEQRSRGFIDTFVNLGLEADKK